MTARSGLAAAFVVVALTMAVTPWHAGSSVVYLLSVACWVVFAALAVPQPRSVTYSALVVMWSLGFPLKLALHLWVGYPYQEPTGDFGGTPAQWDAALGVVICGMAGAAVARLVSLGLRPPVRAAVPPRWYAHAPRAAWLLAAAILLVAAALNWWLSLYQVGVHPVMPLPLRAHVAIAWIVALGGGLLVAAMVDWEGARDDAATSATTARLMAAVCAEAVVSSTSALSRGIVLFRLAPYWLSCVHGAAGSLVVGMRGATRFAVACAAAMIVTLALVSLDRAYRFTDAASEARAAAAAADVPTATPAEPDMPTATPAAPDTAAPPTAPPPSRALIIGVQLRNLLIDRWVGLEGVLAVTAAPVRPSLRDVLTERAAAGVDGWFQRLSRAPYLRMEGFTFLTLAGPLALLATTGSPAAVGGVTMLLVLLLLVIEWWIRRAWPGPHVPAMAGVALANYFAQMNVPYLWMIFLAQLIVTMAALHWLQSLHWPGGRGSR